MQWYQTNPHQFHLITLGTLHALPSPVARRSQKIYKPEYFEVLKKERDARDGVGRAREWVLGLDVNVAQVRFRSSLRSLPSLLFEWCN